MLRVILFYALLGLSLQAPVNTTISTQPSQPTRNASASAQPIPDWFHTNPRERGTVDLLISCFTTLFFAAWTSYHPNIPTSDSSFAIFVTRLKWIVLAAFVPEVVLWRALVQIWAARRLLVQINKLGDQCIDGYAKYEKRAPQIATSNEENRRATTWHDPRTSHDSLNGKTMHETSHAFKSWTMKEALFVVSGGLAVQSNTWHPFKRIIFTPKGLLQLARAGLLATVSRDQIEDKSNANLFGKVLACAQATWFAINFFVRLGQGLSVSLLEIHTLIHVCCAYVIYVVWCEKGYDINKPFFSEDDRIVDMAALFALEPLAAHALNKDHDIDWTDGTKERCELWHCTHRNAVTFEHARDAHTKPLGSEMSWRYFKEMAFTLSDKPEATPTTSANAMKEQMVRSNRAILRLRSRNIHIYWRDLRAGHLRVSGSDTGISFNEGPYAVADVGNTVISGDLDENDLHPNAYWKPYNCKLASYVMNEEIISQSKRWQMESKNPSEVDNTGPSNDGTSGEQDQSRPSPDADADPEAGIRADTDATQPATNAGPNHSLSHVTQENTPERSSNSTSVVDPAPPTNESHDIMKWSIPKEDLTTHFPGKLELALRCYNLKPIIIGTFSALYGAAHLIGWNTRFATTTEMWLWRAAGLWLIAGPCFALTSWGVYAIMHFAERKIAAPQYAIVRAFWRVVYWMFRPVWFLGAAILLQVILYYAFVRMFLLVESLISLRVADPDLYRLPDWMGYLPHFH